jgi:hypothetical protein
VIVFGLIINEVSPPAVIHRMAGADRRETIVAILARQLDGVTARVPMITWSGTRAMGVHAHTVQLGDIPLSAAGGFNSAC